jgi:hypothetical protein
VCQGSSCHGWRQQGKKGSGAKKLKHYMSSTTTLPYRVIQNDCRCFNNLSHTIHFR